MTIEEFNKTAFGAGMEMTYQDKVYEVVAVEFEEKLLAYKLNEDSEQYSWARCENCTINLNNEEHFLKFKNESIAQLREYFIENQDDIRERVFVSFQKGFEREDRDRINLYLDEEFIKICKDELDMDLHGFTEKILKDKKCK